MTTKMPTEIETRTNMVVELTRKQIGELPKGDELLPIAHIFGAEGSIVMGFVFRNQHEKELSIQAIGKTAKSVGADLIVTRIESWTVKLENGEYDQFNKDRAAGKWPSLSTHPKAVEVVMFAVDTKDTTWIGTGEILKANASRQLGEITWTDQAAGIFTGLLRELH